MFCGNRRNFKSVNGNNVGNTSRQTTPTLQSLIYQKKNKDNAVTCNGQPLTAVVKNTMNLQSSGFIDLDRKKSIYPNVRSPYPSMNRIFPKNSYNNRESGSPASSYNKQNKTPTVSFDKENGTPINLYNSPNRKTGNSSILGASNNYLEVHGSYFLNKSILHSPTLERPNFSLVNDKFNMSVGDNSFLYTADDQNDMSYCGNSSAQSVVDALKEKSKRKRNVNEPSVECQTKKMKFTEVDVTLTPSILQTRLAKRKVRHEKQVASTGVQCEIDSEVNAKKVKTRSDHSSPKFGLSQDEINDLSVEVEGKNNGNLSNEIIEKKAEVNGNKSTRKDTDTVDPNVNIKLDSEKECKSMNENLVETPAKDIAREDEILLKLKQSALKKIKAPYEKLFDASFQKILSPASQEKMRKHPVYFTAKIDIDEIQHHREEFGQKGVSLKAFQLDKEEAAKRISDLLGDDDEPDFQVESVAEKSKGPSQLTSVTSATSTTASSTLFGSLNNNASFISSSLSSAVNTTNKLNLGFSFGTSTSLSLTSSGLPTIPTALCTTGALSTSIQQSTALSSQPPAIVTSSDASNGKKAQTAAPSTLCFMSLPSQPTVNLSTNNVNSNFTSTSFNFGASSLITTSITQSSSLPAVSLAISEVSKASLVTVPASLVTTTQLSSIQNTSELKDETFDSKVVNVSTNVAPSTCSYNFTMPTSLPANSGTSITEVTRDLFNAVVPSGIAQSSVNSSTPNTSVIESVTVNPSATTANPVSTANMFNQIPSKNIFGGASVATAVISSQSGFSAVPSLSSFSFGTAPSSMPVIPSTSSTHTNGTSGFSFKPATTTFNFGVNTSQNSVATVPTNIFSQPSVSTVSANVFGQAASTSGNVAAVPTANIFGAASTSAPSQNLFGTPTASTQNIFGAPTATTQNMFGAPSATTTQSIFGQPATSTQGIFGAPAVSVPASQNAFGAVSTTTFGSNTQNAFGIFGQPGNAFGSPAPSTNGSVFGATSNPAPNVAPFGSSSNIKPAENPFGQSQAAKTGFDFSASLKPPAINFGAPSFGSQQPAEIPKPAFSFGAQGAVPSFGAAATSSTFGAPAGSPAFGNPQPPPFGSTLPTPFGPPNAATGGGNFTIGAGGTTNPTRQTQRARRRLRR